MDKLKAWVTGEEPISKDTVQWANEKGKSLVYATKRNKNGWENKQPLTTSQIRKFYGEVMRIKADFKKYGTDVPFLNAKLAYAYGRNKQEGIKIFAETFREAIELASESEDNFNRFVKILEATVAYHKFYGGK